MKSNNRNYIIAVISLAIAFVAVFQLEKASSFVGSSKKLDSFPQQIGSWQGSDIDVSEDVYEILGTSDVLMRHYKDKDDQTVTLAVVYSDTDRSSFHPPEICYLGGGVKLLEKQVETIALGGGDSLKANTLKMQSADIVVKAWYWFATSNSFTHNYYLQQINLIFDWMRYKTKAGALVRVSIVIDPEDPKGSEERAKDFIREATPLLEKFLKNT